MAEGHAGNDYERRDVTLRLVGRLAIVAVALLALSALIAFWTYPGEMTYTRAPALQSLPAPALQVSPRTDMARFSAGEMRELSSYGWIDRTEGIVHMPIEAAMAKVARDGIADWPEPTASGP